MLLLQYKKIPTQMAKRKVFISYHHDGEQSVVDEFRKTFSEDYEVFTDNSLERAANSDDVDYLARVCREAIFEPT